MSRPSNSFARDRRSSDVDRDAQIYARRRRTQHARRAAQERATFDPGPPTDDDWVVADPDTDGVRKIGPPTPVGDELARFVQQRGWAERLRGADAWARWDHIVGADLASRCEPVRLAGRTLVVRAESQVWATQLRYLLATLRSNAERELGEGSVREVRVVVGPLEGRTAPEIDDTPPRPDSAGPS